MNTILKTKVLEGLENPEVGRDSMAEDTDVQSTNDPEQAIDSPTETNLSYKQPKEVVSSPNPLRESEDIENHANATASPRNEVAQESTLNSTTSLSLTTDEPDVPAETANSETIVSVSNVETDQPIIPDTTDLSVQQSSVTEPEVAHSESLEPSDSSFTLFETNPLEESRNPAALYALVLTTSNTVKFGRMEQSSTKTHFLPDDPDSNCWNPTAEATDIQTTNDLEQFVDSLTEFDLRSTQRKEVASSLDFLRESEDIENHTKPTDSPGNEVTEGSTLNSTAALSLRNDEPDVTAETVFTISNVETNQPVSSYMTDLPVQESSMTKPEVAHSAFREPSDSSITVLETNAEVESRNSVAFHALVVMSDAIKFDRTEQCSANAHSLSDDLDSDVQNSIAKDTDMQTTNDPEHLAGSPMETDLNSTQSKEVASSLNHLSESEDIENHATSSASHGNNVTDECTLNSAASLSLKTDGPDLTAETLKSETVISVSNVETNQPVNQETTDHSLKDCSSTAPDVAHSASLEPSHSSVAHVETNHEEERRNSNADTIQSDRMEQSSTKTHFLCDDPVSVPKNAEWATPNSDCEIIAVEVNLNGASANDVLPEVNDTSSKAMAVELSEAVAVAKTPEVTVPPTKGPKGAVVPQDKNRTTEGVAPCVETFDLPGRDISISRQLPLDSREHFLEPLDTCTLAEGNTLMPEDHAHCGTSELKQSGPETKDEKEPELSDISAVLEPIHFFRESSLPVSVFQTLTSSPSTANDDVDEPQQNRAVDGELEGSYATVPDENQKSCPKTNVHGEDVMDVSGIKAESLAETGAGKSVFDHEPNESVQKDKDAAILMVVGAVESVDAHDLVESSARLDDDESHTNDAAKCEVPENGTKETHEVTDIKLSNILVGDGSSLMSAVDDLASEQDSCSDISVQSSKHECKSQASEEDEIQPEKLSSTSEVIESADLLCPKVCETPMASSKAGSTVDMSKPSVSRVNIGQLKRFYQWRNHGLPPNEALEKAMSSKLTPPTEAPHPNCKIELEEIKEVSMLIPASKSRCTFVVETFFGGKDLEEQLKLRFTKSGTERHPNCKHSWEDVKAMFSQLPTESLRWDFVVEVYYKGKKPEEVLKIISNAKYCELANLTCSQLKKYCDWCGVGLSADVAVAKAREPGYVPLIGEPHPECKLPLAEIREISTLVPDRHKFVVEVFTGGKDPGEVLKKLMTTERHPKCNHSWEKLKQMATELPKEPQRWKFMVETYYKGKDTLEVMKACKNESDSRRYGSHGLERLKNYFNWRNSGLDSNEAFKKAKDRSVMPPNEDPHPSCRFSLKEIEQISLSMPTQLQGKLFQIETFFGGKDPEAQLKRIIEHPWDCYSWEDLRQMSRKLPTDYLRLKFMAETYGKHIYPEKVIRNLLCAQIDGPSASEQVTDLIDQPKVDRSTPEKPRDRPSTSKQISHLVDEKVDGISTPEKQNERLSTSKQVAVSNDQQKVVGSTVEQKNERPKPSQTVDSHDQEISKLSLNQLKKYYKWCILGMKSSQALSKAKEPGLIPQTEDPHPDCKLPFEDLKQISLLIPAKYARCKFQVETFFGGKDPEAMLKLMMASANTERHADCQHTWEELQKMSNKLPKQSIKLKFLVETFYGGKEPEKVLEKMIPANFKPQSTASSSTPLSSATSTAKASVDVQGSSLKDELISESKISELSLNQLKKFYKWRILGVPCVEALVKAKEPRLIPQTEDPHPNCKFPFEEIKQMSLLLPPKHPRTLFQVETFFGGKDPEEQLKLILAKANMERHPDCKHTWEELKEMANALPKLSFQLKFVADSFYSGKSPAELLKSMLSADPYTAASAGDVHFVDGTVEKAAGDGRLSVGKNTVRIADSTVIESSPGTSGCHDDGACLNKSKKNVRFADSTAVDSNSGTSGSHDDGACLNSNKVVRFADSTAVDSSSETSGFHDDQNIIEEGPVGKLSNGKLKLYYLRRNAGFDHDTAFSKASKFEGYSGRHLPKSKLSLEELKKMSQSLTDTVLRDRFMIHTYFGGKDPNRTMEYIKLGPRNTQQPQAVSKPDTVVKPDGLDKNSSKEIRSLKNGPLQYYFLWRNKGHDHETALSKVKSREPFPAIHHPHANCMHSEDQLRFHSQALKSNVFRWDRFFIYTYYGGKDPEVTLRYFLSHPECFDPPEDIFEEGMDRHFLLLEEAFPGNKKLKKYYAFRNCRIPHEASISKAIGGDALGGFSNVPHPNCRYTEHQLRDMSQALRSKSQGGQLNFHWDRFVIHTYHGGKDPQGTLKYFVKLVEKLSKPSGKLNKRGKKKLKRKLEQESQVRDVKRVPVPFEPVAKRTRICPDAIIPLDSPNHPSNHLNDSQLENYYLWMNNGCSHKDALVNAQTPGLFPKKMRSRCLVPMEELRNMAQKLPTEQLRKTFIMETYFAGNAPEEVMGHLLSKATNDRELQHGCPEKHPPDMGRDKAQVEVQFANQALQESYSNPTISVEERVLANLTNGELKYYYLWRNKGLGQEQALLNVNKKIQIPGLHEPHPNCKYSEAELGHISAVLTNDYCRQRFLVHAYFGGKDLECAVRHFVDADSPSTGVQAHQANFLGQNYPTAECGPPTVTSPYGHPSGLPPLQHPYQHPAAGLPPAMPHPMGQHLAADVSQTAVHPMVYPHGPPVLMMYPPDQYPDVDAVAYPLPPHQQLVSSFGNMAYPPNLQGAAPSFIHQPHLSGVYNEYDPAGVSPLGYPSGVQQLPVPQVPPFNQQQPPVLQIPPPYQQPPVLQEPSSHQQPPVMQPAPSHHQPPVPQQPSSLTSNINSTRATAHQTPRAEGPLLGIHDPKQSSLKRKPTDELPIKITLKSSSAQPKPPKQCKEQTSPTADNSIPMFIVPSSYPSQSLSESQMDAIESNLLEAILEMDDDGMKPSFKDTCRSNGRFSITCVDQFSVNWLKKYLKTYQPWPSASLKLIDGQPTGIRANAILPSSKLDDDKKILKYIERQNKGLNVSMWTVIQRWDNGSLNTCMDLFIDGESAEVLKKCSTISFKLGSADIIVSKNDVAPTSRTSQSLDPAKGRSPGTSNQSLPLPLNSLKESVSRPEKPSMSHDGLGRPIPKDNPVKSESPVKDTTPSDEQKHSWMDWFYSKKAASTAPSQDRSPLRERCHKSSREEQIWPQSRSPSPKYQRLSHSRSPSPKYRSRGCSPDSYRKPKKESRVSTSPGSSSGEHNSARRRGVDSRQKPSWR